MHLALLQRLFPSGSVNVYEGEAAEDLMVSAHAMDLCWEQRNQLLAELNPANTEVLIAEWEQLYQINRVGSRTLEQRRTRLLIARRRIHSFHPDPIAAYMTELLSATCTVTEATAFRTDDPSSLTDGTAAVDGAHVFYVDVDVTAARAAGFDRTEAQEHLDAISPAHVLGILRADDFLTDDTWSITDRDLLGA